MAPEAAPILLVGTGGRRLTEELERRGHRVVRAEDCEGAVEACLRLRPRLVLVGATLSDADGGAFVRTMRALFPSLAIASVGEPADIRRLLAAA